MKDVKVHAKDILRMIPDEELAKLSSSTKVDYCAKVLSGERMFYLLVFALLAADQISQRKLEVVFNNSIFKTLFNISADAHVTHSSISTRLSKIDLSFFEKAYEIIYGRFSKLYTEEEIQHLYLIRVDSSMVAECCNRLKAGFTVGKKPGDGRQPRKQIKYTMAYDGFAVRLAEVFNKAVYLSEDMAIPKVVLKLVKKDSRHTNLYVIDRGLSSLDNFNAINECDGKFVGRIKTSRNMEVVESLMKEDTDTDLGNLELYEDNIVHLYDNEEKKYSETPYRVIKARFKQPRDTTRPANKGKVRRVENEVFLITNDFGLTPKQVAEAYRRRWDIEVFFKFLKQNLSFSHFVSTSENGIKVILYMTLITAMLVMIYKRENGLGFSIGKFMFFMEMQDWVCQLMVVLNGGNADKQNGDIRLKARIP